MSAFVKRPFIRTFNRIKSLCATILYQYQTLSKFYQVHDQTLCFPNACKLSIKVASILTSLLILVTYPIVFYYRGWEDPTIYLEMAKDMALAGVSAFVIGISGFILFMATTIAGKTFAESDLFWGFIEKRWGERIDKITKDFLSGKLEEELKTK